MLQWRAKVKGLFMLFRVLAVMVWACTVSIVATAAVALNGKDINWIVFAFVLLMAALVQGYPAHTINEIYDWQSGSDRLPVSGEQGGHARSGRRLVTGGSKVIRAGLLTISELWALFYVSTAIVVVLAVAAATAHSPALLWFIVPGYLLCIFYTLPPLRLAYRPFLGEYGGGFAGIVLLVLGACYAQIFMLPWPIVLLACSLGLHYAAIMIFFHYIDFAADRQASPPKRTTVVYLGLEGSRRFALLNAAVGTAVLAYMAWAQHPAYAVLTVQGTVILLCHLAVRPADGQSIVRCGKYMTYAVLAAGLVFGALAHRSFGFMLLLYAAGFGLHKRFGKLPNLAAPSYA